MENKFFTFIKPYLSYIDNGGMYRKPFSWLYSIFAIINLILPILIMYKAVDSGVFGASAKFIIAFIFIWVVIAFASWVSFQLWWDRKSKVTATSIEEDEFVATPVFSHLIQTLGEWIGTWVGLVGFLVALLMSLILGDEANFLFFMIGIPFLKSGILFAVLMPIYGFFILISSRFVAEQFRALSSIANNTKKK